jgi:hypothetical protein
LLEQGKIVLATAVAVPKDWAEAWQDRNVNEPREPDEAPSALGSLMQQDGRLR